MIPVDVVDQQKGYNESEKDLVEFLREQIIPKEPRERKLRTIECSIMDVADDIAYAIFDLEDSFKGSLVTPMDMSACSDEQARLVADTIAQDAEADAIKDITPNTVKEVLHELAEEALDVLRQHSTATSSTAQGRWAWADGKRSRSSCGGSSSSARTRRACRW